MQMLVGWFDCLPVLPEDIGEMILQLRRQVEGLFSTKYGEEPLCDEKEKLNKYWRWSKLLFDK